MDKIIDDKKAGRIDGSGKVLIGGCFDILHKAHKEFIKRSKKQGNILIILLESDSNITRLKGPKRPVNNQITRAKNLSKLSDVDYVILLNHPQSSEYYYNLVKSIRPDIIAVTSQDPLLNVKKEQADLVGGKIVEVMDRDKKYSSTLLIENL